MPSWNSDQRVRLAFEESQVKRFIPHFSFHDRTLAGRTSVRGTHLTKEGHEYTLCLRINIGFPYQMPDLFVTDPSPLHGFERNVIPTLTSDSAMHVWASDWQPYVKICHWKQDYWSARNNLIDVLMKGFIWLEALEIHRQTGRPILEFLAKYPDRV